MNGNGCLSLRTGDLLIRRAGGGFFNVIREVRMCKDGTLAFVPVEEMEKIRENKFTQREIQVTETPQQLKAGDGTALR